MTIINKTFYSFIAFFTIAILYYLFTIYSFSDEKGISLEFSKGLNEFLDIDILNGKSVSLFQLTLSTLFYFFVNFIIASLLGITIGVFLGKFRLIGQISNYYINFFRVMPSIIYIVLFKYQFKFTETYIYFVGVFASIWPVLINTKSGVEKVNIVQREAIKILNLPFRKRLISFILPEAFPNIWDGMKIGLGISFLITITCEYLYTNKSGLGALLKSYEDNNQPIVSMCIILYIGLLGILINLLFDFLETKILWLNKQFATNE